VRDIPSRNPDQVRIFQHTDLEGSTLPSGNVSNKFWEVRIWHEAGLVLWQTRYGRVGEDGTYWPSAGKCQDERSMGPIESKIRSKCKPRNSGQYVEVKLAASATLGEEKIGCDDPKITWLVERMFRDAGEYIATYLRGSVGDLSLSQIDMGMLHLKAAQAAHASKDREGTKRAVQEFYRTIPTQVPTRADPDSVVKNFCKDFREQEDRLEQLRAAVAVKTAEDKGQKSVADLTGAQIECLQQGSEKCGKIVDMVHSTSRDSRFSGWRVKDVYALSVREDRQLFLEWGYDNDRDSVPYSLFHGTRAQFARHIVRTGLKPPVTQNYTSMFGYGVYLADVAAKSIGYMGGPDSGALFVVNAHLGKMYVADDAMHGLRRPPDGYDSVMGKARHTRAWGRSSTLLHNEFVIYHRAQATLTHLIILTR